MQVKIKRKQRLVKKEIDPIISKEDEAKYAQETEGPYLHSIIVESEVIVSPLLGVYYTWYVDASVRL